jgi:hypothetical protein
MLLLMKMSVGWGLSPALSLSLSLSLSPPLICIFYPLGSATASTSPSIMARISRARNCGSSWSMFSEMSFSNLSLPPKFFACSHLCAQIPWRRISAGSYEGWAVRRGFNRRHSARNSQGPLLPEGIVKRMQQSFCSASQLGLSSRFPNTHIHARAVAVLVSHRVWTTCTPRASYTATLRSEC